MPGYVCCHGKQNLLKALFNTYKLTKLAIQRAKQGLECYYKITNSKLLPLSLLKSKIV